MGYVLVTRQLLLPSEKDSSNIKSSESSNASVAVGNTAIQPSHRFFPSWIEKFRASPVSRKVKAGTFAQLESNNEVASTSVNLALVANTALPELSFTIIFSSLKLLLPELFQTTKRTTEARWLQVSFIGVLPSTVTSLWAFISIQAPKCVEFACVCV